MALSPMSASILLRPPPLASPAPSPSPSPSPISTPLPALQADLCYSASSSTSDSYPDLHLRPSSARSSRRIRFAPLPEPDRDLLLDPSFDAPPDTKFATQVVPPPDDLQGGFTALSPTVSPDSIGSSVRSTPTIRSTPDPCKNVQKPPLLLRPFSFFRRTDASKYNSQSASLPASRNTSLSSLPRSSSAPNTPSFHSPKLPRISTDDLLSFGRKSLFRSRPASSSGTSSPRPSSPPPKRSDSAKSRVRSATVGSAPATKSTDAKRDWGGSSSQSHDPAASGPRTRRTSSTATTPGAGGGRHTSVKTLTNALPRPSTAPSSLRAPPKKHVKMLNGRVYGAKRIAAQTLANPFANVREEPEFVEWGYGGMGSVHASAGIGNDVWKGLQRSERGGALLAASCPATGAGGGRGSGAHATSSIGRRKMSVDVPECGMGNVGAGGETDEDGSGMAWLKKRRAEREARARSEQEAKEQKRKSGDSFNASMYASTASTTTSLTACTSATSTHVTTPTTSPLTSRSPSVADLKLTSSPSSEFRDLGAAPSCPATEAQFSKLLTADPAPTPKDEHERHVLTAVRLSPNISSLSGKFKQTLRNSPDMETTRSANSSDDDEPSRGSDEEEEQDDAEHEVQNVERKTALGAGVEKISRHVGLEVR